MNCQSIEIFMICNNAPPPPPHPWKFLSQCMYWYYSCQNWQGLLKSVVPSNMLLKDNMSMSQNFKIEYFVEYFVKHLFCSFPVKSSYQHWSLIWCGCCQTTKKAKSASMRVTGVKWNYGTSLKSSVDALTT